MYCERLHELGLMIVLPEELDSYESQKNQLIEITGKY